MTKTILILAIAAAFVVGTIATGSLIYAQAPPAGVTSAERLEAVGTGTLTCANGDVINNLQFSMNVRLTEDGTSGNIRVDNQAGTRHDGQVVTAELTQEAYNVNGIIGFVSNFLCEETPVDVTISGDCGIGVAVTMVAPGSMTGAFVANVACE